KNKLTINVHIENTPLEAEFDREKITQVIHNLLSNSIRYTPENKEINIYLSQNTGLNIASFIIEDQGIGIPEAELETIFNKFIQSSKTETGAGGTGLGLAICQEIIKAHHGSIYAENMDETGARFVFNIPLSSNISEEP
ncbi:MAG: ATP-binding protein, partial [Gammaproteobacteria bacterium]|nr:ATP-binding protein [Gammaproteobacteria bacterium]